jgi:uncharacterized membrane protein
VGQAQHTDTTTPSRENNLVVAQVKSAWSLVLFGYIQVAVWEVLNLCVCVVFVWD